MPASLPAGVKDTQNVAHLKCRLPQVVEQKHLSTQVLLIQHSQNKVLKLNLRPKTQHIKNSHFLFLELFTVFIPLFFPRFISHPTRWCKCHGNDMLFGIHED